MGTKPASAGSEPGADQRRFERADVKVEVTLESESNFYNGFTENISAGGLFIATYDTRQMGDTVSMEFTIPGRQDPIAVKGEVRWLRELNPMTPDVTPGMGVRFLDLADDVAEAITAFIQHKDPLFYDDE